ncbi:unnamed protein product [Didymodactylos carnosus]|uniref:Uncharacterized protein n=1 Tax=Didymodactylos carnosus TaxID=1234261 RepID=A0A8S2CXR2_9BILA|nr:unnamed protein product [Didymodactylos carnosus]CAF3573363.1 unnamed protein product [Didymodactylos carnosus]
MSTSTKIDQKAKERRDKILATAEERLARVRRLQGNESYRQADDNQTQPPASHITTPTTPISVQKPRIEQQPEEPMETYRSVTHSSDSGSSLFSSLLSLASTTSSLTMNTASTTDENSSEKLETDKQNAFLCLLALSVRLLYSISSLVPKNLFSLTFILFCLLIIPYRYMYKQYKQKSNIVISTIILSGFRPNQITLEMSNLQLCKDLNERSDLYEPLRMHLKPIARLNISMPLPVMRIPGQTISTWEIMDKIRSLILPDEFIFLRLIKSAGELYRFEGELESKQIARSCLIRLDNSVIRISTGQEFRLRAAEAKLQYPSRTDWETFFREAKNMNETKPGERADTVHIEGLPIKWFQEKPNPMAAVQAAAHAIGSGGQIQSIDQEQNKENKPSLEILQQVFSTFGEIRCCDIPSLDPYRFGIDNQQIMTQDTTFDAFIQYSEYISFVKAMDAFRNMKLMHIEDNNVAYTASIKVDFDRTRHLSDRMIKKRRIEQMKAMEMIKLTRAEAQRQKDEEERKKEIERLKIELQDAEADDFPGVKDITKDSRRRQREDKRRLKRLERKRLHEERTLSMKIAMEERKILIAKRKLESMRLLEELFNRVKVQIAQEELSKKERELQEDRLRSMEVDGRQQPSYQQQQQQYIFSSPSQLLPQPTTKEFRSNKDEIEAQLYELRKEFYQKDETIDDILRKRTIPDRKVF